MLCLVNVIEKRDSLFPLKMLWGSSIKENNTEKSEVKCKQVK